MRTLSGIQMLTVGEIIKVLRKFSPSSVMTFQRGEEETVGDWSVLTNIQRQDMEWFDNGKGTVEFKDHKGKVVFTVEKRK